MKRYTKVTVIVALALMMCASCDLTPEGRRKHNERDRKRVEEIRNNNASFIIIRDNNNTVIYEGRVYYFRHFIFGVGACFEDALGNSQELAGNVEVY